MTPTTNERLKRIQDQWTAIVGDDAGEGKISGGGAMYLYEGSELATLRLLKAYRWTKTAQQYYSENCKCWCFSLHT